MLRMAIQVKGFRSGKKSFHPGVSIKTPENRLISAKNQGFHQARIAGNLCWELSGERSNKLICLFPVLRLGILNWVRAMVLYGTIKRVHGSTVLR